MFSQRGKVIGWKHSRVHISAEFPTGAAWVKGRLPAACDVGVR